MKKLNRLTIILLITKVGIAANAQDLQPVAAKLESSIGIGVIQDNLSWSIAGNLNGQNPNIYSELKWQKIVAISAHGSLSWNIWKSLYASGDFMYANIEAGTVTDSDYEGDNRTNQVFFAALESNVGMIYKINPVVSWRFEISHHLEVIPGIGYGISSQKLYLTDYIDLNSNYHTSWYGPFGRLHIKYLIRRNISLAASAQYHQVAYWAKANWNLVESFQHPVSFTHMAKGFGIESELTFAIALSRKTQVYVRPQYYRWSTGAGIDKLFLADGGVAKTRLNDVTRKGLNVSVGVSYKIH